MEIILFPLVAAMTIGPTVVFCHRGHRNLLSTRQLSYKQLAGFALFLGALMALATRDFFFGPQAQDFTSALRAFLLGLLIYEPFPIIAALFRRASLAARDRGDPDAAETTNGVGLTIVILGLAGLAGLILWRLHR